MPQQDPGLAFIGDADWARHGAALPAFTWLGETLSRQLETDVAPRGQVGAMPSADADKHGAPSHELIAG